MTLAELLTSIRTSINQVIKIGAVNGHVRTENHNPVLQQMVNAIEMHASDQTAHGSAALPNGAAGSILYHNGTAWVELPKGNNDQILKLVTGLPTWNTANNRVFNLVIIDGYCYPGYYEFDGEFIGMRIYVKNVAVVDQLTGKHVFLSDNGTNKEYNLAINHNMVFSIEDFDTAIAGAVIPTTTGVIDVSAGEVILVSSKENTFNNPTDFTGMLIDLANQYQIGNHIYDTYTADLGSVIINTHIIKGTENRICIISSDDTEISTTIPIARPGTGYIILKNTHTLQHTFTFGGAFESKAVNIESLTESILYYMYDGSDKYKIFVIAGDSTETHAATSKPTPVDADELGLVDSATGWTIKKLTWANLKATLKTYFDPTYLSEIFSFALSDGSSDLAVGEIDSFNIPYNCSLNSLFIALNTAPVGSTLIVNLKKNGTSIFSTKVSIDASEFSSLTAATPYVLTGVISFVKGDKLTASIDQIGATTAGAGLKGYLILTRT